MAWSQPKFLRRLPRPRFLQRHETATAAHPAVLNRHRIFVLPTRQGLGFAVLLLVMLLGAINYNNSMAFMLAFLLAGVALVSVLHTYTNLAGLSIRPLGAAPCFAGGHALFTVQLSHGGRRPRLDITLGAAAGATAVAQVEGGQAARVVLAVPAPRRGRLPLGRVVVATRYPLGLFRAWSLVEMEAVAIVYPKPSAKAPPLPPAPRSGGRQTVAEAGSDDFRGLRNYQDGDSPRHVHWKAWARQEQLLTKQFQRQQAPELWLDWDSLTGPAETKLSHLCRWLLDAAAAGERYGLRLPGETLPPGQGAAHRHRCLAALALCGEAP